MGRGVILHKIFVQANCQINDAFFFDFTETALVVKKNDLIINLISSSFIQNTENGHGGSIHIYGDNVRVNFENIGASQCRVFCYNNDPNSFHEGNFAYIIILIGASCNFNRMSISQCSFNRDNDKIRGSFHCCISEGSIENCNTSNCYADRHASMYVSQSNQKNTLKIINIRNVICSDNIFDNIGFCIDCGNFNANGLIVEHSEGRVFFYLVSYKSNFSNSYFYDNSNIFSISDIGIHTFNDCYLENFSYQNVDNRITINNRYLSKGPPIYIVNNIMKVTKRAFHMRCSQNNRFRFFVASYFSLMLLQSLQPSLFSKTIIKYFY